MNAKLILLLLCAGLLTGCTDIRTRLSPDLLAADAGSTVRLAAHTTQENAVITAETDDFAMLTDALAAAAGADIAAGHISMLLISGNPCAVLETALQKQWLPPTGAAVSVYGSACRALCTGAAPSPDQIAAAVSAGLLPCRTADTVLGDLRGGSGITALHTASDGKLTLSLWDGDRAYGTLSEDACRGLALLGNRWNSFNFTCGDGICTVRRTALRTAVTEQAGKLVCTVSGTIFADTAKPEEAGQRLTGMLTAALAETAGACGADLLFLRESAVRSRVSAAKSCSQAEWAQMLCDADYRVEIAVRE